MAGITDPFKPAGGISDPFRPAARPQPSSAVASQPVAKRPGRGFGQAVGDTVLGVARGAVNMLSGAAALEDISSPRALASRAGIATGAAALRGLGQDNAAAAIEKATARAPKPQALLNDVGAAIDTRQSEALQQSKQELADTEGFWASAGKVVTDPRLLGNFVAEQVPNLALAGAGTAAAGGRAATAAGAQALERAMATGLSRSAATAVAKKASEQASRKAASRFAVASNTTMETGAATNQAYLDALNQPDEVWQANADYQRRVAGGEDPDYVKQSLATTAATRAAAVAAPISALAGRVSAPFEADVFTGQLARRPVAIAGGIAREAAEEGVQEGGSQLATNLGVQAIDTERGAFEGVAEAAGTGAALGGVMGGGMATGGALARRPQPQQQMSEPPPMPERTPAEPPPLQLRLPPPDTFSVDSEGNVQRGRVRPEVYADPEMYFPGGRGMARPFVPGTARRPQPTVVPAGEITRAAAPAATTVTAPPPRFADAAPGSIADTANFLPSRPSPATEARLAAGDVAQKDQASKGADGTKQAPATHVEPAPAPLADANDPAPDRGRQLSPLPWVNAETGEFRKPTADEVKLAIHERMNLAIANGGMANKPVLRQSLGLQAADFDAAYNEVKRERRQGMTAPAPAVQSVDADQRVRDQIQANRQTIRGEDEATSTIEPVALDQGTEPTAGGADTDAVPVAGRTAAAVDVPAAQEPATDDAGAAVRSSEGEAAAPAEAAPQGALSDEEIRTRLMAEWANQPNDPAEDGGFSFGERLSLQQDAEAFNAEMARSGDSEAAQRASVEATDRVMRLAREIEAAPPPRQPIVYDESPEVLDTDITPPSGGPFSQRAAADVQARRVDGGRVFEVDGGFVVRTPQVSGRESGAAAVAETAPTGRPEQAAANPSPAPAEPTASAVPAVEQEPQAPAPAASAAPLAQTEPGTPASGAGEVDPSAQATPAPAAEQAAPATLKDAAHQAATSPKNDLPAPTDAQKEAGNYKKGHVRLNGHDISIENPAGSKRQPEWPALKNHYGYFKGTVGKDNDHVDVFMTDRADDASLPVFVVDQVNKDGSFDEHKVVMGTATEEEARKTYLANYSKGWTGLGGIKGFTQDEFKAWIRDPAKTKRRVTRSPRAGAAVVSPKPERAGAKSSGGSTVDAPSFRKWFGDSKVVDPKGRPLVVYHGTTDDIDVFDSRLTADGGFHFGSKQSADQRLLQNFGEMDEDLNLRVPASVKTRVMPVYLSIQNPKTVRDADNVVGGPFWYQVVDAAKEEGFDGLRYINEGEGGGESWVAFNPEQIKSATSNNGNFDRTDSRILFSRRGWDKSFPDIVTGGLLGAASSHADYAAAKAGDKKAALRLARDVVTPEFVADVRAALDGSKPVVVPVVAREEAGNNAIPRAAAEVLAARLGLKVDDQIVQADKVGRGTGVAVYRLANQPGFAGEVKEGQDYLLIDDTLTQGGTLAQLKTHIEDAGGRVVLATALTGKTYSRKLSLSPDTLASVRERFGSIETWWRGQFGYGFDGLTESEARSILALDQKRLSPDGLRDRVAAAGVRGAGPLDARAAGNRSGAEASGPAGRVDLTTTPEFRRWFGSSKAVGKDGQPLVLYRGEHGADTSAELSSRLGSITFTDSANVASQYAQQPNRRGDRAEAPRVTAAYLRIANPIVDNRDDPFLDLSLIEKKLGREEAVRIARKFSAYIENTGNWQEDLSETFASVGAMMDSNPERVGDLYFDAYLLMDDADEVARLKAAGYDGAIHVGNGESSDALEFRVFDAGQVKSATANSGAFNPNDPRMLFSRGDQPAGLDFDRALQLKSELTKDWGDAAPAVVVVRNAESFPDSAKADPEYTRAEGFYDGRPTVWINAATITSERRFAEVLAHEAIGHYGIERILGKKEWGSIVDAIGKLATTGDASDAMLSVLADVRRRYGDLDPSTYASEVLAVMAERGIRNSLINRVVAAVRRFLRRVMPSTSSWSENDLRALLAQSESFLRAGRNLEQRQRAVQAYSFSKVAITVDARGERSIAMGGEKFVERGNRYYLVNGTGHPKDFETHEDAWQVAQRTGAEVIRDEYVDGEPQTFSVVVPDDDVRVAAASRRFFSKPADDVIADIDAVQRGVHAEGVLARARQLLADAVPKKLKDTSRPTWLGALTTRHLTELGADYFSDIKHYSDDLTKMQADRNTLQSQAEGIAENARKWASKNRAAARQLFDLMHEATIDGVDPAEAYKPLQFRWAERLHDATDKNVREAILGIKQQMRERSGDSKKDMLERIKALNAMRHAEKRRASTYGGMVARWNQLSPEAQQLYRDMRDAYRQRSDAMEEALVKRIADLKGDGVSDGQIKKMSLTIRQQFEDNRLQGVYFPLQRFGRYFVSATKGDDNTFLMFESGNDLERAVKDLRGRGWTIGAQGLKGEAKSKEAPPGSFVADIIGQLHKNGVSEKTQDDIYQIYLQALPELSMRKHQIHRKSVPGFDTDAVRAFAYNMHHGSHQLARLRYSHLLQMTLDKLRKDQDAARREKDADTRKIVAGDAIIDELGRRHEWIMNPQDSQLTNIVSSLGFTYYLGATPAAALVNLTQTALVTYPYLASRHGPIKAMNYLLAASRDAARTLGNIQKTLTTDEERAAHAALMASGALDKTQAHNLAGIAEGGLAGYNPAWAKTMEWIGIGFHKTEVINREASAMAAFRLARSDGASFDEAVKAAHDAVFDTHFDYSNANRARFMQSGTAKVLLMFRQYSLNMTWTLGRMVWQATKGQTPEVKRIARRNLAGVLGMSSLFSGVLGLPTMGVVMGTLNALQSTFGDDDEPWDAETEFRAFLADMLGKPAAALVTRGAANTITGADIAGRVGLSELWVRDADRELEGRGLYYHLLEQAAGPMGGVLKNVLVGKALIDEGHTWRGVETMLPKSLKDIFKAGRYATQGVNTLRGDPLIEDLSLWSTLLQLNGFSPAEVSEQYERNRALKYYEQHIVDRRQHLMNAFALALRTGDAESRQATVQKIQAFNRANPELAITSGSIARSIQSRARYSAKAEAGIVINPKLAARLNAAVGE